MWGISAVSNLNLEDFPGFFLRIFLGILPEGVALRKGPFLVKVYETIIGENFSILCKHWSPLQEENRREKKNWAQKGEIGEECRRFWA